MRKLGLDILAFFVLTAAVFSAIEHHIPLVMALFVLAVGLAIVS